MLFQVIAGNLGENLCSSNTGEERFSELDFSPEEFTQDAGRRDGPSQRGRVEREVEDTHNQSLQQRREVTRETQYPERECTTSHSADMVLMLSLRNHNVSTAA